MLRKGIILLALLALVLAAASPALADKPEKEQLRAQIQQVEIAGVKLARAFQGEVKGTPAAASMVVTTAKWGDLTIKTDAATQIKWPQGVGKRVLGESVDLRAFAAGDRVVVQLVKEPASVNDLMARAIHVVAGQTFVHYTGKTTAVSASKVTVSKGDGEAREFNLLAATQVFWGKDKVAKADLKVDQVVTVVARTGSDEALSVVIHSMPKDKEAEVGAAKGRSEEAKVKVEAKKPAKTQGDDADEDERGVPQGKGKGLLKVKPNRAS